MIRDWLALTFIPGLGSATIHRLVTYFGSPTNILSAQKKDLLEVEGIGKKLAGVMTGSGRASEARERADRLIENAARTNCRILCPEDVQYPQVLHAISDQPVILFCQGKIETLKKPAVAIVGSRAATTYGKRVSYQLAYELARNDVCVVSGMAMGIDGEAHAGALVGGGATIGVLGCGVDVKYPHQHADLFQQVAENGLLVSEYSFGTPPEGFRFPERNRIISGISLGTVVVEASLKSGSLITATLALDQGRDVFAVPGRIDSPKSKGTHRLLQEGAKLVSSVDDILEELDVAGLRRHNDAKPHVNAEQVVLPEKEEQLLSYLDVYPVTIDELVSQSGYDSASVFHLLLELELKGIVRQLPGQQYERVAE